MRLTDRQTMLIGYLGQQPEAIGYGADSEVGQDEVYQELILTLLNAGLVESKWENSRLDKITGKWTTGKYVYSLTDEGKAKYDAVHNGYYGSRLDCPSCVVLFCVCSYKSGCLRQSETEHNNLGCHGTHD